MKYPKMREIPTTRELVDAFKGYNHNLRIGDGEFYDMTNLSSDNYPVLSPRTPRGIYKTDVVPNGIIAKDVICWCNKEGDKSVFIIEPKDTEYSIPITDLKLDGTPKTLVSMGSYVIILPDKKYVNTIPTEKKNEDGKITKIYEFGDVEAYFTTAGDTKITTYYPGYDYANIKINHTAPTDPASGDLWLDTSSSPYTLKRYSSATGWVVITTTTYIKISNPGIGTAFEVGDSINLTGYTAEDQPFDFTQTMIIKEKGTDYISVKGYLNDDIETGAAITVKRTMPNMDFIIESENRLWGCRYGVAINGEMVNEIYASKLGDFKNWNCFEGISTDSYVASVGTDGPFTGAVAYLGYPMFFKENCIHKVYGYYPSNYQIQTTECRGVEQGSSKSLTIVNEVLYYKSRSAVCAYDGSLPVEISSYLGDVSYGDAVAGAIGNKYYISMRETKADTTDKYNLFVYDTAKGMWHREDGTQVEDFCNYQGDLYYIDRQDNNIKTVKGSQGVLESKPIKWTATTGVIGTDSPDKKYISRMDVRMSLEVGSRVAFYAEYDSSGEWEYLFTMTGTRLGSFPVPIRPQRCDHMRLKIIGEGRANIYSICKTIEQGSDV